ncbi:SAM-dependent methyltransferase [Piscinibacter koreensis]|uniref:Class I SAM-dependent methyltransferase n=1 Tax=Piscinibacter koreensis TaxID=2742824 RepID=A0A7Y6TV87_9BURK|nr:class I SAM-dependent methyltransferase [Schlegelella koreensis]NUZ04790.1 class I SAM-dependent methyltransferase [Schlegelella koreensis]
METKVWRRAFLAAALLCGLQGGAVAQPASAPFEPQPGQSGKDVIWLPSPDAVVDRMLQMAEVKSSDFVVDLGSGDGKIAIAAARNHGARALGLEYNPQMVEFSRRRAREAGFAGKVEFRQADIFASDFSQATVVTMYLLPDLNMRLRPTLFKLRPGTRIVSHSFGMGDWTPDEVGRSGTARISAWVIPANASGEWALTFRNLEGGGPQTLTLRQRFQMVEGDVSWENLSSTLVRPHLQGDSLSFGARHATGEMLQFQARVAGNRMTGTVTRPGRPPVAFEAVRKGAAPPIEGVEPERQTSQAPARPRAGA